MDDAIPRSLYLLFLIIAGGFFSGAETAFSYTNAVRARMLAEEGDRRAKRLVRILDDFDAAIVTLLIVINVLHIAASAIATTLFIGLTGSTSVGSVTATVVLTLAIFIFSETLPKNFAKTNCDRFSLAATAPMRFFMVVLFPLAFLLKGFGVGVRKLFRLEDRQPSVTEDEFSAMVEDAGEDEVFEPAETEIIRSAIEFGDTRVHEIMLPKSGIVGIPVKAETEEIRRILLTEKYSRFPVYRGSLNNIVGILRTTNALWELINAPADFDIRELMTKPLFCQPDDEISEIFERMCKRKNHFAVVRDEDKKTVGILSMEDILEEIVGEIYDEDDAVLPEDGPPAEEAAAKTDAADAAGKEAPHA
ncbi:MAG: HlyC/CorC family transporter [Clostridia bacterium]|nr:HlyC/CorC family transporter [Clostridia bacterium]